MTSFRPVLIHYLIWSAVILAAGKSVFSSRPLHWMWWSSGGGIGCGGHRGGEEEVVSAEWEPLGGILLVKKVD